MPGRWDDGIAHVILAGTTNGVPLITTLWLESASVVMCVSVTPLLVSVLSSVWFERMLAASETMYGAVYRIWNNGYCWLDRPLGDDELVMYKTGCTGLVALPGPPAACGLFVVLDGDIQPYASTFKINWTNRTFGARGGNAWPLPASTPLPIPVYDTSICRLYDCEVPSALCAPCIYAHDLGGARRRKSTFS